MFDLLIKGGTVVDGTGCEPSVQDVAIKDGLIVAVGPDISGEASEVVDAKGLLVTPGFVDIHTHYDAQVAWDSELLPSSAHGVTSVVISNCGVGFAPVRKQDQEWLMQVMQVIEDVPVAVMKAGMKWDWESFSEYLDVMERNSYALDIATQVTHTALRKYVMGDRADRDETPNEDEVAEMRRLVREAVEAGAMGFSTSRCSIHQTEHGPLPGTMASDEEIDSLVEAVSEAGGGVYQLIPSGLTGVVAGQDNGVKNEIAGMLPDPHLLSDEIKRMRRLHQKTGVTCTFSFPSSPKMGDDYARSREQLAEAHAAGEKIFPQYAPRPLTAFGNLDVQHIFTGKPTYRSLAHLPRAERARKMAEPEIKAAILSEDDVEPETHDPLQSMAITFRNNLKAVYLFSDDNMDYEQAPSQSVHALATAQGRDPVELYYDLLIADEGRNLLVWFADYRDGDLRLKQEYVPEPSFVMGLSDGGAHAKLIVDGSFQTSFLAHWGKNRTRGPRFPIEMLVNRITQLPAKVFGFTDRGVIKEGMRADINVIDFERLSIGLPHLVGDLPTGAERFLQDAQGYVLTIVKGVVTRRDDKDTGARPGRLFRNPYSAAARAKQASAVAAQ